MLTLGLTSSKAEQLYFELGALAKNPPDLSETEKFDVQNWLGRVHAILEEALGNNLEVTKFTICSDQLTDTYLVKQNRIQIMNIIHRTLAELERASPTANSGAFISAGHPFDALTSLGQVIEGAASDVLFIDPYSAANILSDFAKFASEGVNIRILAGKGQVKENLEAAAKPWKTQYGVSRPLEIRLAKRGTLHDRAVLIDDGAAWSVGTSFNGLGKNSPTLLQRVQDPAMLQDKLEAYKDIWDAAEKLS